MAVPDITTLLTVLTDEPPAPEDVKAGWTAFVIFLLLIAAVVLLGFSLVKQLRKAEAAKEAGVYGDPVKKPDEESADPSTGPGRPDQPADDRPSDDRAGGSPPA